MSRLVKLAILIVLLSPTLFVRGSAQTSPIRDPIRKFDEFGDLKCEDEYARLDNFAIQLQHESQAKGLIIFYGGKTFRGKLPKKGEAEARAARLKPYLVRRRGIPSNQVIVINGGYAEEWHVEIWIVPQGARMPAPNPSAPVEQIKFRKGRVSPRDYRCRV
jgi:hypothetical protein